VAFSRSGTAEQPGCIVIMSNGDQGEKSVAMGEGFAGKTWRDYLGHREETLTADEQGTVVVRCNSGSVSVWVLAE